MTVLVYLNWKERCFRANDSDLKYLKSLLPRKAEVIPVRSDRAFLGELKRATHVITWHFRPEWYALAPKLRLVATPAAGRELVAPPPAAANPARLPVLHFGHYHGRIMAESVAAFCLAWSRGFFRKRPTAWSRDWLSDKVFDLSGTKAVIFGYGNVGRAIGAKLETLGVEVRGFTHAECDELLASRSSPLATRLGAADWCVVALPSTTGTDDLVGARLLSRLPRRCVFVNVGRGNCVDEKALLKALRTKRIAGAYLDVIKSEPSGTVPLFRSPVIDVEHPETLPENLVLMPHSSAFSPAYLQRCFRELLEDGCLR